MRLNRVECSNIRAEDICISRVMKTLVEMEIFILFFHFLSSFSLFSITQASEKDHVEDNFRNCSFENISFSPANTK